MDVDNEVLISLVFDRPPLWDKGNEFHTDRNFTEKCWKEISLEMKQDEYKLRKRWRYLRDQFAVELGKIALSGSGDEANIVSPKWRYFKPLLFLKSVVKARATTGRVKRTRSPLRVNVDDEIEDSQSTYGNDFPPTSPSPRNMEYDDASSQSSVSPAMSSFGTFSKRPKKIEYQKLNYLQERENSRPNRTNADNEHLLFFKSLLPHIDKIPPHRLLSFRSRIQSVVDEFAYQSFQHDDNIDRKHETN